MLVLWGEGEGDEEHIKVVHMGKGKSWSVVSVNLFMILTIWLERSAMRPKLGGLALPLTGFPKAEVVS